MLTILWPLWPLPMPNHLILSIFPQVKIPIGCWYINLYTWYCNCSTNVYFYGPQCLILRNFSFIYPRSKFLLVVKILTHSYDHSEWVTWDMRGWIRKFVPEQQQQHCPGYYLTSIQSMGCLYDQQSCPSVSLSSVCEKVLRLPFKASDQYKP